ncbi:MAG: hypothetical protein KDC01_09660 [Flavobacteriales bacterium]|jgi:hypothetical protein|nr:hypothetical protein [Flavobacteriales bacterium]
MNSIHPSPEASKSDHIVLHAFCAPDEPGLCSEFLKEHRKVLTDIGVSELIATEELWTTDPNCYVIVALHDTEGMVGGIRLQLDVPERNLPMVDIIEKTHPQVHDAMNELLPWGNGEVCGLWAAHRFLGKGVPGLLSKAVTTISVAAGARRMVCFVAHYTQKYPAKNGFIVMENVGEHGFFPAYPIPRITTIAMVNPDTMLLEHASNEQRRSIYSLRLRPEQTRVETYAEHSLVVEYKMRINAQVHDLYAFQQIQAQYLGATG